MAEEVCHARNNDNFLFVVHADVRQNGDIPDYFTEETIIPSYKNSKVLYDLFMSSFS